MGKIYYLDLQTLLVYLRTKSGTLTATLTVEGKPCTGNISLQNGKISRCVIKQPQGKIEGERALAYLQAIREWQVDFDNPLIPITQMSPAVHLPQQQTTHSGQDMYIPRPKEQLLPILLVHFNSQQRVLLRTVYTLVDGQRSIAQIKTQLNLPPEIIDTVLARLYDLGTIE